MAGLAGPQRVDAEVKRLCGGNVAKRVARTRGRVMPGMLLALARAAEDGPAF